MNSFVATLTDGYGRPVSPAMLEALGLQDDPPATLPAATSARDFTRGRDRSKPANFNAPFSERLSK